MVISKRGEKWLGIFFAIVGFAVVIDVGYLTHELNRQHAGLQTQISCNNELILVLRNRSDARVLVDETTQNAQHSLAALLEDMQEQGSLPPNDPHVIDARQEFEKASEARANPSLWAPYPDCVTK